MPRIPKDIAGRIERGEVERGGGKAIDGYVLAHVIEVTEEEEKESGFAGQTFKFEVDAPREHKGTWIWDYLSYGPKSEWKWAALWEGFGYDPNSDTDELVEDKEAFVILDCSIQVQEKGKNAGKERTQAEDYLDPEVSENRDLVGE